LETGEKRLAEDEDDFVLALKNAGRNKSLHWLIMFVQATYFLAFGEVFAAFTGFIG
jgi:hypothetical protein